MSGADHTHAQNGHDASHEALANLEPALATGREQTRPSEFAQGIAKLIEALSPEDAHALHRLLSHQMAVPSAAQRRYARLGLLMDLVPDRPELSVAEYDEARAKVAAVSVDGTRGRVDSGERSSGSGWPTGSALAKAYRSWFSAVRAAQQLALKGSRARVKNGHENLGPKPSYRPIEVLDALVRCRRALTPQGGNPDQALWPTEWEYAEWVTIARDAARLAGKPDPRLPNRNVVRQLFGDDFQQAVEAARRRESRSGP